MCRWFGWRVLGPSRNDLPCTCTNSLQNKKDRAQNCSHCAPSALRPFVMERIQTAQRSHPQSCSPLHKRKATNCMKNAGLVRGDVYPAARIRISKQLCHSGTMPMSRNTLRYVHQLHVDSDRPGQRGLYVVSRRQLARSAPTFTRVLAGHGNMRSTPASGYRRILHAMATRRPIALSETICILLDGTISHQQHVCPAVPIIPHS